MERNALRLAPFALGFVLMSVAAVLAEDGNNADNSEKTHILTLGTSIELAPAYPGASHRRFSAMPSIDIRRMDEPQEFSPPDDSIDYGLIDIGNFSAGPVIGLRDGRSRQESSSLNGLYRIKSGFEVGAFAQYWIFPNQWRVRAEVRGALTNRTGLVYDVGSDAFAQVGMTGFYRSVRACPSATRPIWKTISAFPKTSLPSTDAFPLSVRVGPEVSRTDRIRQLPAVRRLDLPGLWSL